MLKPCAIKGTVVISQWVQRPGQDKGRMQVGVKVGRRTLGALGLGWGRQPLYALMGASGQNSREIWDWGPRCPISVGQRNSRQDTVCDFSFYFLLDTTLTICSFRTQIYSKKPKLTNFPKECRLSVISIYHSHLSGEVEKDGKEYRNCLRSWSWLQENPRQQSKHEQNLSHSCHINMNLSILYSLIRLNMAVLSATRPQVAKRWGGKWTHVFEHMPALMSPWDLIPPTGPAQISGPSTMCHPGVHSPMAISVHPAQAILLQVGKGHACLASCPVRRATHISISSFKEWGPERLSDWSHPAGRNRARSKFSFLNFKLSHLAMLPAASQAGNEYCFKGSS